MPGASSTAQQQKYAALRLLVIYNLWQNTPSNFLILPSTQLLELNRLLTKKTKDKINKFLLVNYLSNYFSIPKKNISFLESDMLTQYIRQLDHLTHPQQNWNKPSQLTPYRKNKTILKATLQMTRATIDILINLTLLNLSRHRIIQALSTNQTSTLALNQPQDFSLVATLLLFLTHTGLMLFTELPEILRQINPTKYQRTNPYRPQFAPTLLSTFNQLIPLLLLTPYFIGTLLTVDQLTQQVNLSSPAPFAIPALYLGVTLFYATHTTLMSAKQAWFMQTTTLPITTTESKLGLISEKIFENTTIPTLKLLTGIQDQVKLRQTAYLSANILAKIMMLFGATLNLHQTLTLTPAKVYLLAFTAIFASVDASIEFDLARESFSLHALLNTLKHESAEALKGSGTVSAVSTLTEGTFGTFHRNKMSPLQQAAQEAVCNSGSSFRA